MESVNVILLSDLRLTHQRIIVLVILREIMIPASFLMEQLGKHKIVNLKNKF